MDLKDIPEDQLDQLLDAVEALTKKSPLDYVPHPPNEATGFGGMKLFHCSPKRVRLVLGGNQSGKTVSGANELLFHATGLYPDWYPKDKRYNRPIKARVVGPEYREWGKVVEDKIYDWLPRELIVAEHRILGKALGSVEVRHVSGGTSVIQILTHEQDDITHHSWTGDFVWFDEPPPYSKYIASVRGIMAQGGRIIMTMTPLKEPWLYEKFILTPDEYSEYWNVDMYDNPHLKEQNRQMYISQMAEDDKEAMIHGRFRHLAGRIYKEFNEAVHIVDEKLIKIDKSWPVYFILDPADRRAHHGLWAVVNPLGVIYIIDELVFKGNIKETSREILLRERVKLGIDPMKVIRIIDPNKGRTPSAFSDIAGITMKQEFARHAVYFIDKDVNDDVITGHLAVRERLVWNKEKPISENNHPKLFFVKNKTVETVRQLLLYSWDEWKGTAKDSKNVKEVPKDLNKDLPDCLRYLCIYNPQYFDMRDDRDPTPLNTDSYTGYGPARSEEYENNNTKFTL